MSIHPKLAKLLGGHRQAVECVSREEAEKVRRTAANPQAFSIEQNSDGVWRVRYAGRE